MQAYGQAQVKKWEAGTQGALPTSGPPAAKDKKVWVISCGQESSGCATSADDVMTAGQAIGWSMTLYDGKLTLAGWTAGVEAAIAAHADGIVLDALDCPLIKQPLEDAKKAGIKVIGMDSFDCNDPAVKDGAPLFSAHVIDGPSAPSADQFSAQWGQIEADWILAQVGGDANVVYANPTDNLATELIARGFVAEIKAHCPTCKLHPVPYTAADYASGALESNITTAIQTDPGVNAVASGTASAMLNGVGPALQNLPAGLGAHIHTITGEGTVAMVAAAEQGKFAQAGVGVPYGWIAWAVVDALNRVFAGQPQVSSGIGLQLWTVNPTRNIANPANGYTPPVNYEANYEKIWGVK